MGRAVTLTPDQLRGRVRVKIDGEDKFLRFDQNALSRLVDALGLEGLSFLPGAIDSLEQSTLVSLVWAGRLWEEPDAKREDFEGCFFPLLPTYHSAIEGINLALWGEPSPTVDEEDGGSEDTEDPPQSGTSGAREPYGSFAMD